MCLPSEPIFQTIGIFETAGGCILTRKFGYSVITISDNATPIITMERSLVLLQEATVSGIFIPSQW